MARLIVKYVQSVRDRYGNVHHYFRRPGYARVKLPGLPGSKTFAEAYQNALDSVPGLPGASRVVKGTFADLMARYFASAEFATLQPKTQTNYRKVLGKLDFLSAIPVRALTRVHVLEIRDKENSIVLIRRLKTLLNFAVERGFRDDNPADKVKPIGKRRPFRPWTDKDIEKFLRHYKPESRQNLAITLLLYTGVRRSDVVDLGWSNVTGNILSFVPKKTSHTDEEPKRLFIPMHSELRKRLADLPKDAPAFLMTTYGNPMSEAGFSNWFSDSARDAGLPHNSSPHGLRKAAARRLAEAGCSTSEIAAITGHSTLKEVERYTASANQAKLARSAIRRVDTNDE